MELVKLHNSKYDEYESLLLERDQLVKEIGQVWTVYLRLFGKLIADTYEEKIECIKYKKMIAYYQNAINHGMQIDPAEVDDYLEKEMREYYANLDRMLQDNEAANAAKISSLEDVERAKRIYRRLAKRIHPDLNPLTERSEELKDLWNRIQAAFRRNNAKELEELEVLVRKTLEGLGADAPVTDIPDIEEKTDDLKEEIEQIKNTEPYTLSVYIEDEGAREQKKTELQQELASYREYRNELYNAVLQLMQEAGVKVYVE